MQDSNGFKANWLRIGKGILEAVVGGATFVAGGILTEVAPPLGILLMLSGANGISTGVFDGVLGASGDDAPAINLLGEGTAYAVQGVHKDVNKLRKKNYTAEAQVKDYNYSMIATNLVDTAINAVDGISTTKSLLSESVSASKVVGASSDGYSVYNDIDSTLAGTYWYYEYGYYKSDEPSISNYWHTYSTEYYEN